MWKFVAKSVRGSAHFINGLPCQDAWAIKEVSGVLICALSDGAGSAKFADEGSKFIVNGTLNFFEHILNNNPHPVDLISDFDESDGYKLVEHIQELLTREAIKSYTSIHDYAGTLLVAIIHESRSCFYQIGDGAWCVSRAGILGAVTWPTQGEFAGQTAFVTSPLHRNDLQFMTISGSLDYIIGMTDGIERLALNMQHRIPHRGFCDPMIKGLVSATDIEALGSSLETFLSSDSVCTRTDDDKTLALIVHVGSL
jgi:hypothetical protein